MITHDSSSELSQAGISTQNSGSNQTKHVCPYRRTWRYICSPSFKTISLNTPLCGTEKGHEIQSTRSIVILALSVIQHPFRMYFINHSTKVYVIRHCTRQTIVSVCYYYTDASLVLEQSRSHDETDCDQNLVSACRFSAENHWVRRILRGSETYQYRDIQGQCITFKVVETMRLLHEK